MARINNVIGTISFVAMLLCIPVIGTGIWLAMEAKNSCVNILQWPVIILGILILLVALAGVIGSFRRNQPLIVSYYIGMIVLIILLAGLVLFICLVTARGSGRTVPGRSYKEYESDDFSQYLNRITDTFIYDNKWDRLTACLNSSSMCAELNQTYRSAQEFFNAHITPFQAGCCTPPIHCNYTYVNPTNWINPDPMFKQPVYIDCPRWSNNQKQLCYACPSCRGGLLHNLTAEWRRANLFLIITLVALIVVYLMGCCALKKTKLEDLFH